jgi:CRP-like cAMP-binding protein
MLGSLTLVKKEPGMDELGQRLSRVDVFDKLMPEDIAVLVSTATPRHLPPGSFLCRQGDAWPYVFFVEQGLLRWALCSSGGREYTLFTTGWNELVFAHSTFDGLPMPAGVVAEKSSDVLLWPGEQIKAMLFEHPAALWDVPRLQMQTMRRAREIIYGLAFQPVAARLALLLLELCSKQENAPVSRDLRLSDIAAMIATSPEVVCRLLHQFQTDGILEITRADSTLHARQALEKLIALG